MPTICIDSPTQSRQHFRKTSCSARHSASQTMKHTNRRTASLMGLRIIGYGSYVPNQIVTNEDLNKERGFNPEWILQRTGINERRYCVAGQDTSDLCVEAALRAIESASIDPADIDLVIVATFTPDFRCPSTACLVQDRLGLDAPSFDLSAACSGFMYALTTAGQFISSGNSKLALVIGGDCMSRIVDSNDQRVAPLFGDGAGAVLITAGAPQQGLVRYQLGSDGGGASLLIQKGGAVGNSTSSDQFLRMDGRAVFKWAVRKIEESCRIVLERSELEADDIDLFVMHQANLRILHSAADQLGIPQRKIFSNIQMYGNTSAASIPIALDEAYRAGRMNHGDRILLCGFGAGLAWGTGVLQM